MITIIDRLESWRKERDLDISQGFKFELNAQVSFIFEEIGVEYLRAKNEYEKIDALCDTVVFCINGASLLDNVMQKDIYFLERNILSAEDIIKNAHILMLGNVRAEYIFKTIIRICFTMIEDMGYNFKQCMDETLKEIESRKGGFNPDSGKWEKFKDEESKKLWYKADYSKCKIKEKSYNDHPETCQCEECQEWQQDYNKRNNTTY